MVVLLSRGQGRAVRDGAPDWQPQESPWQDVGATNVLTPLSSRPPTGSQSWSSECPAETSLLGTGAGTAGRTVDLGRWGPGTHMGTPLPLLPASRPPPDPPHQASRPEEMALFFHHLLLLPRQEATWHLPPPHGWGCISRGPERCRPTDARTSLGTRLSALMRALPTPSKALRTRQTCSARRLQPGSGVGPAPWDLVAWGRSGLRTTHSPGTASRLALYVP